MAAGTLSHKSPEHLQRLKDTLISSHTQTGTFCAQRERGGIRVLMPSQL